MHNSQLYNNNINNNDRLKENTLHVTHKLFKLKICEINYGGHWTCLIINLLTSFALKNVTKSTTWHNIIILLMI